MNYSLDMPGNTVQLQVDIQNEAQMISDLLHCNFNTIWDSINLYSNLESPKRTQLTLQDYFNNACKNVSEEVIIQEGEAIQNILPTAPMQEILKTLRDFACEENRVRITVRKLLLSLKNDSKRSLPPPDLNNYNKKLKVIQDIDNPCLLKISKSDFVPNDISKFEVPNSTIINHTDEEIGGAASEVVENSSNTEVVSVSDSPAMTLLSISQSQSLEMDSQATIITTPENTQTMQWEKDCSGINLLEGVKKFFEDIKTPEVKPQSESEPEPNTTSEEVTNVDHYNVASCSSSGDTSLKIKLVRRPNETIVSNASTSKLSENENYNLYKHLQEMFNTLSKSLIKTVCDKHCANKSTKPTDAVFGAIVSDLLYKSTLHEPVSSSSGNNNFDSVFSSSKIPIARKNCDSLTTTAVPYANTSSSTQNNFQIPPAIATDLSLPSMKSKRKRKGLFSLDVLLDDSKQQIAKIERELYQLESNQRTVEPNVELNHSASDQLDIILNDLVESVEGGNMLNEGDKDDVNEVLEDENYSAEEDDYSDEGENHKVFESLIYPLMEMFPEACPKYIRKICRSKTNDPGVFDDLVSQILDSNYPKRQKTNSPEHNVSSEEQLEIMKQILPDADPNYLQIHCERLINQPENLKTFIANLIETRDYPTMKDYLRKQQLSAQQKQYTTDFSVQKFLEVIPDPTAYFTDSKRKAATVGYDGFHYALCFLRNHYPRVHLNKIREVFKSNNLNFLQTCKALTNTEPSALMRGRRALCRMPEPIQDIPLLQEIAYIEHLHEINAYISEQQRKEQREREEARAKGLFQTCSCCFDDEVMPKDIFSCENGCIFCKECVKKGAEVTFGDGKLEFSCLSNCPSHFSLQTLQAVLNPKMFSIIALKKQVEEVKAAGIEELEVCPFCDFATIPAREDKLFRCLNPECMKESCRLCKEPSHVPLRCEEVEKEDDVKRRTYIENKMTEALLRKCYKCGMKFIKADGCNKMTCSCGAMMCYICGKPVTDYKHFNGAGGDRFDLCPLYSDTNKLHEEAVLQGGTKAKEEIGVEKLKFDPTVDIKEHYKTQAKNNPTPYAAYANQLPNPNQVMLDRQLALQHLQEQLRQIQHLRPGGHPPQAHQRDRHHRHHRHHRP